MDLKKIVLVLGMHRSGTSSLMGTLEELGLFIGNANSKSIHNKKGNKEIPLFRQFHDKILKENSANWMNPKIVNDWTNENIEELRNYIKSEFTNHEIWGLKDPRIVYLLKGWFNVIPKKKIIFITSIRHPLSVANSLLKRGNVKSIKEGLIIWRKYNHRILKLSEKFQILYIDFDGNPEKNSKITYNIYQKLIEQPLKSNLTFFNNTLVNTKFEKDECPPALKDLYQKLIIKCKNTEMEFLNL